MVLRECLRAARVIARWMGSRLGEIGLTPQQLEVLDVLGREDGVPLSCLRDALCCVGSNVTALVDRMERDGLVERRRDAEDRRVVRLCLTPAGREKLALLGDPRQCCPEALTILTSEERRSLLALLRKLTGGLTDVCPPGGCCSDAKGDS